MSTLEQIDPGDATRWGVVAFLVSTRKASISIRRHQTTGAYALVTWTDRTGEDYFTCEPAVLETIRLTLARGRMRRDDEDLAALLTSM